jgi:hypothetical protein
MADVHAAAEAATTSAMIIRGTALLPEIVRRR